MTDRRKFLSTASLAALASATGLTATACGHTEIKESKAAAPIRPLVISTWEFGVKANEKAMKVMNEGGSVLDAVEQGVKVIEADGDNSSVGYGGLPDRDGRVTLDACIMGPDGNCGSVCALEQIMHPITVARKVMEETPHVMLVGEGALEFALSQGMQKVNLLTAKAKRAWEAWKVEARYHPKINVEMHDTIGLLAIDQNGDIAGACTTSGLAFKMRGRVGDSPVIGSGLYVDNEVGGAAATGLGEAVLKTCGSFLVVELMRQGKSPAQACKEAVGRIISRNQDFQDFQVGFVAINKAGETGGYSIQKGFSYAVRDSKDNRVVTPPYYLKD